MLSGIGFVLFQGHKNRQSQLSLEEHHKRQLIEEQEADAMMDAAEKGIPIKGKNNTLPKSNNR